MYINYSFVLGAAALLLLGCDQYPHRTAAPAGIGHYNLEIEGVAAALPDGAEPADLALATRCDAGDLGSCNQMAALFLADAAHAEGEHAEGEHTEGHGTHYAAVPHNEELGLALLTQACGGGFLGACARLGALDASMGDTSAEQLIDAACDSGDIGACWTAAHGVGDATRYLNAACAGGVRDACVASLSL